MRTLDVVILSCTTTSVDRIFLRLPRWTVAAVTCRQ